MIRATEAQQSKRIRCAIYTRKSTEDGLEQEFNSLDAQRDAGEAYIASQLHEGWECLPTMYDDGGYTGGNLDRPAMQRLMSDIDDGKIDCVVVYKVDRLSRSLMDFSRIMEKFDARGVAFVSVTQQFNTASSMGRLILNVLLSFAQFEREMISERTRDKIAAARRRGKWSGGMPLLGYNVIDSKLVVIPEEAERVRQIFKLYLKHNSLLQTVKEVNDRGWRTKSWTTKKGTARGGKLFEKTNLHTLLTNPTYIGQVRYRDEVHAGEHQSIVDGSLFVSVQKRLRTNGRGNHEKSRNKHGALLRSLLRCKHCDRAMVHSTTTKRNRRYRYYVCGGAQKSGHASCPSPSIPADQIEAFVVGEIKTIASDHELIAEIYERIQSKSKATRDDLLRERDGLIEFLRSYHVQLQHLAITNGPTELVADLQTRISTSERRHTELQEQIEVFCCLRPIAALVMIIWVNGLESIVPQSSMPRYNRNYHPVPKVQAMAQDISLDSMSVSEKLRLMEDVWASLCQNTGDVQSPEWHEEVLSERRRRLEAGETKVSSWDDAKARLSKLGQ